LEVDILADGALDLPDDVLCELDYTVCSIHSRFSMNREQQTERVLRAMDNRYFTILGHATGRLLLKRPGYELDFERIVPHAKSRGRFFELNSSPDRLDLSAENARLVRGAGIQIAISTDSHSSGEYSTIRYGLEQGRPRWPRESGRDQLPAISSAAQAVLALIRPQSIRRREPRRIRSSDLDGL